MSKLPNVKGRISYITSHARQENLYATYRTADNAFWNNLARESRQEFQRSGAEGKCIEARELIIKGVLIVYKGNDNIAFIGKILFPYNHQIPIVNSSFNH